MKINFNATKVALYLIIFVAFCSIIYFSYKYAKKKRIEKEQEDILKKYKNDVTNTSLSYPLSKYDILSKNIYEALKGFTEDEDAIYDVFRQLKNYDDLMMLFVSFGVRDEKTLSSWIIKYFNDDERGILNSILSEKNIDFSF